jgi:carbon storage regulator
MALVLSRSPGESIVIGDSIRVTVTEVRGRTVRLSIDAPAGVSVDRAEVRRQREQEQEKQHEAQ